MKIFKYTVEKRSEDFFITAPQNLKIIRMDFVDDGHYYGNFVWAIVNPNDPLVEQKIDYKVEEKIEEKDWFCLHSLGVKEKQDICTQHIPVGVKDEDGKLYLLTEASDCNEPSKKYRLHFYKTGQLIKEPVEDLRYIGFCRLWIMMELALYGFIEEL